MSVTTETASPWVTRQLGQLLRHPGHAWILQGPPGLGQFELARALTSAWLCEAPTPQGACGQCASCHGVAVHTHPDLMVLMPEVLLMAQDWPLPAKARSEIESKRRKPSSDIRVQAVRSVVDFAQRTSARGRGKAVLVYPADKMNGVSAAALLKTLEEPAGDTRFVLATDAAHLLLPTIRSRCLAHTMVWPGLAEATDWLLQNGVDAEQAPTLLRAAGGRPAAALQAARAQHGSDFWRELVTAVQCGDASVLADLPLPDTVAALQKICHDALAARIGASPRFLDVQWLPPKAPSVSALSAWWRQLGEAARQVQHPLNRGLTLDYLVSTAQQALNSEL